MFALGPIAQGAPFQIAYFTHVRGRGQNDEVRSHANLIMSASYFETIGIPLVRGRYFETSDIAEPGGRSRPVVILSQTLARRMFGTEDAVGPIVEYPRHKVAYEVIGVVGDIRNVGDELRRIEVARSISAGWRWRRRPGSRAIRKCPWTTPWSEWVGPMQNGPSATQQREPDAT
jgi:hypothetical protein